VANYKLNQVFNHSPLVLSVDLLLTLMVRSKALNGIIRE